MIENEITVQRWRSYATLISTSL